MRRAASSLAFIAALLCGQPAAVAQDPGDCGHPVPQRSVRGCSAAIARGGAPPEALAASFRMRGAAHVIQGEHDSAMADLDEAIRLDPADPEAFTSRGDAHARRAGVARIVRDLGGLRVGATYTADLSGKDEYARAIADYDRALRLNGTFQPALHGRELARLGSGEKNRVEDDLLLGGMIQHLHRSQAPFLMRQLAMLLDPDRYARMAADRFAPLDRSIRDHPNDAQPYLDRAWAFVNFGKLDFAIADYTRALAVAPGSAKAYVARAEALRDRGEHDRAVADCTAAIRLAPDEFRAYALRGALFERQGEKDEAVADYRRALSLEPRAAEASDGLERLGVAR